MITKRSVRWWCHLLTLLLVVGMLINATPALAVPGGQVDVLIGFAHRPGPAEQALIRGMGGVVHHSYHLVSAIAASLPEAALAPLVANPHVTRIEPDLMMQAMDELDNSWGVKRIGSGTVHSEHSNHGAGVSIAIMDSGVDYNHTEFMGNYVGGYDFVKNVEDAMDVYGHGTHVAGTACAAANGKGVVGVASACDLYSLRVLDDSGYGYASYLIAALQWAVDNKMQVANLSLGWDRDPGSIVRDAFAAAEASGMVIVAAAGNSGTPAGRGNNVIYPARYDSVIAVAATDANDRRASFSSTGDQVELAAPGVAVLSTWNNNTSYSNPQPICVDEVCYYKYGSGTSMASPHVAGVAALVLAANPRLSNSEVRAILQQTAEDLGLSATQQGYGLVRADAAVALAMGSTLDPAVRVTVTTDKATYASDAPTAQLTVRVVDEYDDPIISLPAGAFSTTLGETIASVIFDETTTPGTYTGSLDIFALSAGDHVVQVAATDARVLTGSGSAVFTIASDLEDPPATASVTSISYRAKGNHLDVTVVLRDGNAAPVAGAAISVEIMLDDVPYRADTAMTDSAGQAVVSLRFAPRGRYTTTVTNVIADGLIWDGVTPENTYIK